MEGIVEEMGDQEYHPRKLMLLIQGLYGFRQDVCIQYVEDMKHLGFLVYGSEGRLRKRGVV